MDRQKRILIILAMLLIPCAGSMLRIIANSNIRSVEFVIIFATGAVTGLLIRQIFSLSKKKDQ